MSETNTRPAAPPFDEDEAAAPPAPPRQGLKKGLYLLPSIFTTLNIAMGFYAIMNMLRAFQLLDSPGDALLSVEYFDGATRAIGFAVVCDALDGRIARMTKTTTEIGVQLDSIADVVTFGVAPAVMAYAWGYGSALPETHQLHSFGFLISFFYLMCGGFRLARFNVQASRPRVLAAGTTKTDKKSFVGLPIPAAAGLLAAVIHFAPQPLLLYGPARAELYSGLLMALVALLSVLMVSTIRYTSFKAVETQKSSPRLIIAGLAALGMCIWLYSRYAMLAIAGLYVLHGLLWRAWGLVRRTPSV